MALMGQPCGDKDRGFLSKAIWFLSDCVPAIPLERPFFQSPWLAEILHPYPAIWLAGGFFLHPVQESFCPFHQLLKMSC